MFVFLKKLVSVPNNVFKYDFFVIKTFLGLGMFYHFLFEDHFKFNSIDIYVKVLK